MRDDLLPHQTAYVGRSKRLEIPLHSVVTLRRVAEELHGLATTLEYLSHRQDPAAEVLLEAGMAIRRAEKRLGEIRGRGRPPRGHNI